MACVLHARPQVFEISAAIEAKPLFFLRLLLQHVLAACRDARQVRHAPDLLLSAPQCTTRVLLEFDRRMGVRLVPCAVVASRWPRCLGG